MDGNQYVDIFATKGLEYLLVIGFLLTLIAFWKFLNRPAVRPASGESAIPPEAPPWFRILDGLYFHQGHSWVRVEEGGNVVVGMDDFAQRLVGKMGAIRLPRPGEHVHQGLRAWDLIVDSKTIPMRSPVNGEVVAVNEEVLTSPQVVNKDPYEGGWLMKVRAPRIKSDLTNLLSGNLARAWMDETVNTLRSKFGGDLGIVLQDGGVPVLGIAKNLSEDKWHELASEFLLDTPSAEDYAL